MPLSPYTMRKKKTVFRQGSVDVASAFCIRGDYINAPADMVLTHLDLDTLDRGFLAKGKQLYDKLKIELAKGRGEEIVRRNVKIRGKLGSSVRFFDLFGNTLLDDVFLFFAKLFLEPGSKFDDLTDKIKGIEVEDVFVFFARLLLGPGEKFQKVETKIKDIGSTLKKKGKELTKRLMEILPLP